MRPATGLPPPLQPGGATPAVVWEASARPYVIIYGGEKLKKSTGPGLDGLGVDFHGGEERGRDDGLGEAMEESPERVGEGVGAAVGVKLGARVEALAHARHLDGVALRQEEVAVLQAPLVDGLGARAHAGWWLVRTEGGSETLGGYLPLSKPGSRKLMFLCFPVKRTSTSRQSSLGTANVACADPRRWRRPSAEHASGTSRIGACAHTSSSSVAPKQDRA